MKKRLYLVLICICFGIAVGAMGCLLMGKLQTDAKQQVYEQMIEEEVVLKEPLEVPLAESIVETEEIVNLAQYNIPELEIDFTTLQEQNPDVYAWIHIPDTKINYPILQHPTELDYYLNYNIDGTKGYPGCIYTQFMNQKDFSDFNTVIYGHNMKNGTMLANVHYYEDQVFFDEHPYIYIYTPDGPLVYQVFGAYTFSNIHLLMGFDLTQESIRQIYIDNIWTLDGLKDNFNREVEVTTESKLLTLCTCINTQPDKRYLLSAVLVADGRANQ